MKTFPTPGDVAQRWLREMKEARAQGSGDDHWTNPKSVTMLLEWVRLGKDENIEEIEHADKVLRATLTKEQQDLLEIRDMFMWRFIRRGFEFEEGENGRMRLIPKYLTDQEGW